MIPDSSPSPQTPSWKAELSRSFNSPQELLAFCETDHLLVPPANDHGFRLRVTRHYASLIEKGNPSDPLLLQVLPDVREMHVVAGYTTDPVGDRQSIAVPGLIRKYRSRVLLTLSSACAIHCRYCFRRHFPYKENLTDIGSDSAVMHYLANHSDIDEVILSGGDPLMQDDDHLQQLVASLNRIPHIRLLRIHTRMLSVLPERITDRLVSALLDFQGDVVLVTHINHPNELDAHNLEGLKALTKSGFTLFNQSVLLKRVNDDAEVLRELSYGLIGGGVVPYYLHRLDRVSGSAHFDVSPEKTCRVYRQLQEILPGYLLPRLVQEIPGQTSKSTVHC